MKILIVSEDVPYPNMGGLAKHALNLARSLVRAGHNVDFLGGKQHPIEVAGNEGEFGGRFIGELDGHLAGWKERKLGMLIPQKRSWVAQRFARIILGHASKYDVIHYHGHIPNVARYIPARINFIQTRHDQGGDCVLNTRFKHNAVCEAIDPNDCASCITMHPNAMQRTMTRVAVTRHRKEVAEGFQRHKTVFVSALLQRNFARTMGSDPCGTVVHNFLDLAALKVARNSAATPYPQNEFHIFIAAKLYPSKGVEPFLNEIAHRKPKHFKICIAGDGALEKTLRAKFESEDIQFLGWCRPETTLKMAAQANAIVVPSVWEDPCPSTILEGLLLGKPTFALARGGAPEMAIYASNPKQFRLHDDMRALVDDLLTCTQLGTFENTIGKLGGAEHATEQLLKLYQSSP